MAVNEPQGGEQLIPKDERDWGNGISAFSEVSAFEVVDAGLKSNNEGIVAGGRDVFPQVEDGLEGVENITVLGWGQQGPAQAQNFRDTLADIESSKTVRVGLREDSQSIPKAQEAGFTEDDGTLGNMLELTKDSDFVIALLSDGGMVEEYQRIFENMKPGATLGLSHGFLKAYLDSIDEGFPEHIDVVLMAPKGMGNSVRKLYVQGKDEDGAGINSSIAVLQDVSGKAANRAVAWAIATGAPYVFETSMINELRSDLSGERGILLGGVWAIAETRYDQLKAEGLSDEEAFQSSANAITGIISSDISTNGLLGAYNNLSSENQQAFMEGFNESYDNSLQIVKQIYASVETGKEIESVITQTRELAEGTREWDSVEDKPMWAMAREKELYGKETEMNVHTAKTMGVYIAMMMAQINHLRSKGHEMSEIVNESLIEAIDSLNPFMAKAGVARMVDGCSYTARLGTRKWGPKFDEVLRNPQKSNGEAFDRFLRDDDLHSDIETCFSFRPTAKLIVD